MIFVCTHFGVGLSAKHTVQSIWDFFLHIGVTPMYMVLHILTNMPFLFYMLNAWPFPVDHLRSCHQCLLLLAETWSRAL